MIKGFRAEPFGGTVFGRRHADRAWSALILLALAVLPTTAFAAAPIAGDDTGIARSGPGGGEQVTIDVSLNDSDPDGDTLSYTIASGSFLGNVIISPSGLVTYTAPSEFTGTEDIGIIVSDGVNDVISNLSITVVADVAPTALDDSAATLSTLVPANSAVQIAVLANDSDGDGDFLSYNDVVISAQPTNGSVTQSCAGNCQPPVYTPNAGFVGTDTFTYFVRDTLGASSNDATVTVNVTAANSPPTIVDDSYSMLSFVDSSGPTGLNVLGNDSDAEGDPLTVTAVTQAANGTVTLQGNNVSFRPQQNFRGVTTFTYTVWDGIAGDPLHFVTATVTVTVQNRAPNSQSPTATTVAGQMVGFAAISTQPDPENDTVSVTSISQPTNGSVVASGSTGFEYTPNPGFTGVDTFNFVLSDSFGATANSLATVTVTANTPPTLGDDTGTTRSGPTAGEQVNIDASLNDSDPDGDPLSYNQGTGPANGSVIVSPSGLLRYTPNAGFTGIDTFTYVASDGVNPDVTGNVSVTVVADLAPVGVPDTATTASTQVPANSAIQILVLANDTDGDDTLSYNDLVIVQQPTNGSVTQSCGGNCLPPVYQPNAGFAGTDTFTYRAVDALGAQSNVTTVTVTVTSSNSPPTLGADTGTARSGPTSGAQLSINATLNDTDPDGDQLSYGQGTAPANGVVQVTPTGTLRYTPNAGFTGIDTFTYLAGDGVNPDVTGNVSVTVIADIPPVAVDDTATTVGSAGPGPATSVSISVFDNDSDSDGDAIAYRDIIIVQGPANGSITQNCLGACSPPIYQPTTGFFGTDTFTYRAVDALGGQSNLATVTVTVTSTNSPPVVVGESANARSGPTAGEQITINAAANDSDPDGDPLSYSLDSGSFLGSAGISAAGVITYTPPAGYTGGDSFNYSVSDGINPPVSVGVNILVVADVAPVAADDSITTAAGTATPIPFLANDTDSDGDVLSVAGLTIVQQPANGTLTATCTGPVCTPLQYQPNSGFAGIDTFTYTVTDALGAVSNVATVTVTVTALDLPPTAVISGGNRTIPDSDGAPGELVTFDSTSSSDPEGSALTCLWTVNGVNQSAGCGPNIQFPLLDGANTVALQVSDVNQNLSPVTSVSITVQSNTVPLAIISGGSRAVADTDGVPGETVAMDGSCSSLSNGTITAYEWSVGGQVVSGATGARPSLDLPDGASQVSLVVIDNSGTRSAPATVTITVGASVAAPVVTIAVGSTTIPDSDGQTGENVPFTGSATDADGTVAVSTFRWFVNDQQVASANGQATVRLALANGPNTIILVATDNAGNDGSDSIVVTVGEASVLTDLPGVEGDPNLESTAAATETTCSTLLKLDPASLTPEQVNLRATCDTIYSNVDENSAEVVDALKQIGGQQVTAQQSTAIDFTSAQMVNVGGRLTALRQGASGFSANGLNIGGPVSGVPVAALASLTKSLFGEGGSSGDDEAGGLLDDRLGIFLNGSLRFGDKDETAQESGFKFDTLGVTAGVDYRFTDAFVAGLALGYGTASADFDAHGGTQDSDSYTGSVYGSWYGQNVYFDGIASLGTVSYDSIRNIDLFEGAIVDKALGQTDGLQLALGVSSGYDFGKGGLRFGPNVALNYIKVDIDGFHERTTGTSGLAMAFGDQTADSLTLKAGGHFNYSLSRKWGVLSPHARFDIVREFANESQRVSVRYANDPTLTAPGQAGGTFVIFTDNPDEYYFLWAIGVAAQFVNGLSGFIDYEQTEALDSIRSAEVSFGVRYQTRFR